MFLRRGCTATFQVNCATYMVIVPGTAEQSIPANGEHHKLKGGWGELNRKRVLKGESKPNECENAMYKRVDWRQRGVCGCACSGEGQ